MSWVWMSLRVPSLSTEPSFMAMIWTASLFKYLSRSAVTHFSSETFTLTQSACMRYWSLWVTRTTVRLSSCRYFRIPSCIRWSLRWMSRAEKGSSYRDTGYMVHLFSQNRPFLTVSKITSSRYRPFLNVYYSQKRCYKDCSSLLIRIKYLPCEPSPEVERQSDGVWIEFWLCLSRDVTQKAGAAALSHWLLIKENILSWLNIRVSFMTH